MTETRIFCTEAEFAALGPDTQDILLLIWPPAWVPTDSTLSMLRGRALAALAEGADSVEFQLPSTHWLTKDQVQRLLNDPRF
jgi:hypothetical protein